MQSRILAPCLPKRQVDSVRASIVETRRSQARWPTPACMAGDTFANIAQLMRQVEASGSDVSGYGMALKTGAGTAGAVGAARAAGASVASRGTGEGHRVQSDAHPGALGTSGCGDPPRAGQGAVGCSPLPYSQPDAEARPEKRARVMLSGQAVLPPATHEPDGQVRGAVGCSPGVQADAHPNDLACS